MLEDADEGFDGQGALETDARRHVESVYHMESQNGSPNAAAAGRVLGAFKMAQARAEGAFYGLGPACTRRETAAQDDGEEGYGEDAQVESQPCVDEVGKPGQEGERAEEDCE